jgi:hypothetical protein
MTSLMKIDETSIIKTDEIGRRQTSAARRKQLLDEFERSGLSAAKFAALAGLKYSTFAAWAHRRRQQPGAAARVPAKPTDPVRWLEALVEPGESWGHPTMPALVLLLPGGVRLEMTHARQAALVATLLRALEKPC